MFDLCVLWHMAQLYARPLKLREIYSVSFVRQGIEY